MSEREIGRSSRISILGSHLTACALKFQRGIASPAARVQFHAANHEHHAFKNGTMAANSRENIWEVYHIYALLREKPSK